MGKVTTVEIEDDVLNYINVSIKRGRFKHLKEFINYCLKLAVTYTMDEWDVNRGIFYIHPCRVTLIPSDVIPSLIKLVPEDTRKEAIESIISCLKPRIRFFNLDPKNTGHREKILELLTLHGIGKFTCQRDIIEVTYSVLPADMVKILLESALELKLEVLEVTKASYIFKILP
ncbi:MAG: hypothetical protein QXE58_03950 [Candidatus Methanomethylicia archaeon]